MRTAANQRAWCFPVGSNCGSRSATSCFAREIHFPFPLTPSGGFRTRTRGGQPSCFGRSAGLLQRRLNTKRNLHLHTSIMIECEPTTDELSRLAPIVHVRLVSSLSPAK